MRWFQIVDTETGRTMTAANQDGEILIKTPARFISYWNNPDATRSSYDSQGWFKTGMCTSVPLITCYTFASCFCTHCFTSAYLFCVSSASLLHVASWATVKQAVREVGTICPAQACKSTISSYLFARWDLFLHVGYLRHQQQHIYWKWCPSHVTCDVGYLCAYFSLPRPLCSRRRPDVRDRRQTSVSITG